MKICIKTNEGEYVAFDSSNGDAILIDGTENELNIIEPSSNNRVYIYIPKDSDDNTGEDLVHHLLNGASPDETLQELRESMGMMKINE